MPRTASTSARPTSRSLLRDVSVADLDLDREDGVVLSLTPAPGGPPVRAGAVYALVRLRGRPVATLLTTVPAGADPADVLTTAFRARYDGPYAQPPSTQPC